jgi:predicted AAA+ superfamily ATPase
MSNYVLIKDGSYRNQPVKDVVVPLIKNYQDSANGGFITVERNGAKQRIKVLPTAYTFVDESDYNRQEITKADIVESTPETSDEVRIQEIAERFEILDEMTRALKVGDIRALIVTGPPGVGKSYGVEEQLTKDSMFDALSGGRKKYEVVKGAMTALGLYAKLYEYSDAGNVLVFDDCDSVLLDDLALNILKAALDSGKKRMIYWNAESNKLAREGIPDKFEFKGSACFITNIKFDNVRSKRLQDHLEALQSRCHYLDLTLDTMRDKLLRIKQIAGTGALFDSTKTSKKDADEVIEFMAKNRNKFREMSLRMALKVADLQKISPTKWRSLAESTCMKRV